LRKRKVDAPPVTEGKKINNILQSMIFFIFAGKLLHVLKYAGVSFAWPMLTSL